jgi:6-phosphogluconolactonase
MTSQGIFNSLFSRNFTIDPSGKNLLATNQHSNTIVSLRINDEKRDLVPTGYMTDIPRPVYIKFLN